MHIQFSKGTLQNYSGTRVHHGQLEKKRLAPSPGTAGGQAPAEKAVGAPSLLAQGQDSAGCSGAIHSDHAISALTLFINNDIFNDVEDGHHPFDPIL